VSLSVTHVAPHVSDTCFGVLRKDDKYVNAPARGSGQRVFTGARTGPRISGRFTIR
jgi:hypothetical protein